MGADELLAATSSGRPAGSARPSVFQVRGLQKVYHMGEVDVHALRGIDLEVFEGELLVLLGPSGSGKSTLLNIVGGLDRPTGGKVLYRERDLTAASESDLTIFRRDAVGFVFQFSLVGLTDRADHFPAQLSGGEQQRVAIARAIAKRPDVLLCDEPTGALDITTGAMVLEAISRVNEQLGTTVAVITHNAAIAGLADRVLALADGRIASERHNAQRVPVASITW
jgi:putative ABC transport system ATP-binding protein